MKTFKIKTNRKFAQMRRSEFWPEKYYHHILRANESAESVAWYIWMIPVRAGIIAKPADYPCVGSFTVKIPKLIAQDESWRPAYRVERRWPQEAAAARVAEQSNHG